MNYDCQQRLEFYEYNTWAEYKIDVSEFEKEDKNDFVSKKFQNSINNNAEAYEECIEHLNHY